MTDSVFDAAGFLTFDLAAGELRSRENERLVVIPAETLDALPVGQALEQTWRRWGRLHGASLAAHLRKVGGRPGIEVLADHLGGSLAALGLGKISVEIRGDALVFRLTENKSGRASPASRDLLSCFLGGYLEAIGPDRFEVLPLDEQGRGALFFAGCTEAVGKVRGWVEQGAGALEAVERLSKGQAI
ncbi:MAG: hypothetical protein PHU25_19340 [Deltaproteobacteria bacterium]|nr:hypothetical protein [Deltaproteobacteria bacterium]